MTPFVREQFLTREKLITSISSQGQVPPDFEAKNALGKGVWKATYNDLSLNSVRARSTKSTCTRFSYLVFD